MNCGSWYDRSGLERVASELTKMSLSSNLNAPEPGFLSQVHGHAIHREWLSDLFLTAAI